MLGSERQSSRVADYTEEIPQWKALCDALQADAQAEEKEAFALLLREATPPADAASSAAPAASSQAKKESDVQKKMKQRASDAISRARKAYGYLFAALPADLRLLVADVPQGYAFGIWSFLEKKFRNTQQDSVMALWERLTVTGADATCLSACANVR